MTAPIKPRRFILTFNDINYYAIDEGGTITAFILKTEADQHYAEVLEDYRETLLESHTGTSQ